MKLKGYVGKDGHCYIWTFLVTSKLDEPEPLRLLVDTGASITTILDGDCARLGLDCTSLSKNSTPTIVVGGVVTTYILPEVAFIFRDTDNKLQVESLEFVDVISPAGRGTRPNFSIMGIDLLRRFERFILDYKKEEFFLER